MLIKVSLMKSLVHNVTSNFKFNRAYYLITARNYRIKTPSFLKKEERWMLHVCILN